jgi:hypothetical protein
MSIVLINDSLHVLIYFANKALRMKRSAPFLIILLLIFSCKPREKEKNELFLLLSPALTNVDFVNQLTENEQFNIIQYLYFNNGAGVAAGDINNDGLPDLYFTSNQNPNKLYLNKGNLKFEDITEEAGVPGKGDWKTGVTMADVNGDGFPDFALSTGGSVPGGRQARGKAARRPDKDSAEGQRAAPAKSKSERRYVDELPLPRMQVWLNAFGG